MSKQTPYITLCGFNDTTFGWVDFAGYLDGDDKFVVTHLASYKLGETTSKFGGESILQLDLRTNEIWTAFFCAAGVVYKNRNFKFPGEWENSILPSFPYECKGKVSLLRDALRGKWLGGLAQPQFGALNAAQTSDLLSALERCKCAYRATNAEARVAVIANMGTLAVQSQGSLPQAVDLRPTKAQYKKPLTTGPLSPEQEKAKALAHLRASAEKFGEAASPSTETSVVVPRQVAQPPKAQVAPPAPVPAPKKGKKAPKAEAPQAGAKPPMKVVKSLDGGNPFQALS